MTILLTGGGSGGHITPLLAVARELKSLKPDLTIAAVCERNGAFAHLYEAESAIDTVYQLSAGKFRRYSNQSVVDKLLDVKTAAQNFRDLGRTLRGYTQAKKLLKELKPDAILIKGGFISVPVGKAAAALGIPYITHDSDSIPGLANRLIASGATYHATGMPVELYSYPAEKTVYTGIPLSAAFERVTPAIRTKYREEMGLKDCEHVITVVGGSQGAHQLNQDVISIIGRLMNEHPKLGIAHLTGSAHEEGVKRAYDAQLLTGERSQIVVTGFTDRLHEYSGAADIVIARAGATNTAEFSLQGLAVIMVPGQLSGGHQDKNAHYYQAQGAVMVAKHGDATGLYQAIKTLLSDDSLRTQLGEKLHTFAKPHAAKELAKLTLKVAEKK
jgi:UDP-N-acetylglucosamine--N-acetylmuramyl-(pentapeptide) pyrophosphoryl-undecaprenol N-acetylglucosamine transferase